MNPLSLFYTFRAYVESYAGFVGRRFLTLIWVIAICIAIWFYGYLLGFGTFKPLQSERNRLIAIAAVLVGWLIYLAVAYFRKRKADKALIDDLAEGEASPDAEGRAEVETLSERLKEALALLRKVVKKRFGYVYELPWYLLIGAPGSGKTTSLINSGLKFPLGDALGGEPVKGVGGTRNCNWWFAEEAILIDTAGRYTTQGDFKGVDKRGWSGFLGLLKKHRPSEPINGVLVTLAIPDILAHDPAERLAEIRAIRQRLAEMDEILGARVPVYVLLTKADLLGGFVTFFDGLAKSDREQVWGTTFDLELSQDSQKLPDQFLTEFDLLRDRINAMLLERLQQEPDIDARGRIFQLPAEMSALREPVYEVLTELCSGSKLISSPMVRGVYLTSGTQEFLSARATVPSTARGMKRSYFLTRLFSEVIFEEAALIARDKRLSTRQLLLRRVAGGVAAAIVVVVLVGWLSSYAQNSAAISQANAATTRYAALSKDIPVRDVADEDFLRILPALDSLAGATAGFKEPKWIPVGFGLDQERKVAGAHRLTYAKALNALLLPRLMVHLQKDLQRKDAGVGETFDALKFYGMLGGLGPIDQDFSVSRAQFVFAKLYPGEGRAPTRAALAGHVAALVKRPLAPINVDERLVADARAAIRTQTLPERAYDLLRGDPSARTLKDWTAATILGTLGEPAFVRRSGRSLRDGVPGLYTRAGFQTVVAPQIAKFAEQTLQEGWVRGEAIDAAVGASDVARDTLRLYLSDFQERWRAFLADVTVKPADDLPDMTEVARILAGAPYPIESLARAVSDATSLAAAPTPPGGATAATAVASATVTEALATTLPVDVGALPDPYAGLREALGPQEKNPSQVAAMQPLIEALYAQLSRAASSTAEVAAIFNVDGKLTAANQALVVEARRLPPPVDQWVGGLAASVDALAVKTARASLQATWAADGGRVCEEAIAGRYPFDRSTDRDVAMDDFVRVFGPTGIFDTFFTTKLAPFVDVSTSPWTWKGSFGTTGDTSDALKQFEAARKVKQAFFPAAGQPAVTLNITPVSLDDRANAVIMEIGNDRVVYFHGPIRPKTIVWPSREGTALSRVIFQPDGWDKAISRSGPWSALRLFDLAEKTPVSDDRFRATFGEGGKTAVFEVQVGSILNPFATDALTAFRCPAEL